MGLPLQKELIGEVVRGRSWAIIVLDACRYDFFVKVFRDFLEGELTAAISANSTTPYWLRETWVGYYDAVYVSANPYVLPDPPPFTREFLRGYRPGEHFRRIVPAYLTRWDEGLGTVRPEAVVDEALRNSYPRMVIHFLQPHYPYIGEPRILGDGARIAALVREGRLRFEDVLKAYEGNLRLVLKHVAELVGKLGHEVVVVTSDHGEMLTPHRIEHPPNTFTPELIHVPWLWVRR